MKISPSVTRATDADEEGSQSRRVANIIHSISPAGRTDARVIVIRPFSVFFRNYDSNKHRALCLRACQTQNHVHHHAPSIISRYFPAPILGSRDEACL